MIQGLIRNFLYTGLFLFVLAACHREAQYPEGVVATLSGTPVSSEDLRETARFIGLETIASQPLDTWSPLLASLVFRETIYDRLLEDLAKKDDLTVSDEELSSSSRFLTETGAPSRSNTPYDPPRALMRRKLLLKKAALKVAPPPAITLRQLNDAYQKDHDHFITPEKALVKDIVVRSEDEGKEILTALSTGTSFSALAKAKSLAPEGKSGGLLHPFALGEMPAPFNKVFSMKPGEVSPLISSPYGYHILKLIAIIPSKTRSFSSVKEDLRRRIISQIRQKTLEAWFSKELHHHPVVILPHYRHLLSFQEE